jgi:hypothetical protein
LPTKGLPKIIKYRFPKKQHENKIIPPYVFLYCRRRKIFARRYGCGGGFLSHAIPAVTIGILRVEALYLLLMWN